MTQENNGVDPTRLDVEQLARLLSAASGIRIDAERITADVAAGAPTGADGSIHLVHYAAWLVKELAAGNADAN
ncbi:MAG: hypothetical protein GXY58_04830 [Planctomycetaceae bacterium]|nr:hypothetical protein [Planctomycetaceae bacterium]